MTYFVRSTGFSFALGIQLAALLGAVGLRADEGSVQTILAVSQEGNTDKNLELSLALDPKGDVLAIRFKTKTEGLKSFPLDRLGQGIVLYTVDAPVVGHKEVVRLVSNTFSSHSGGAITIDYLVDATLNKRGSKEVELVSIGSGRWALAHRETSSGNAQFSKAIVKPKIKSILFHPTPVGVESITLK